MTLKTLFARLPRVSLSFWIGICVVATVLVTTLPLLFVVEHFAKDYSERQSGEEMSQIAWQVRDSLDRGMYERYADIARASAGDTIIAGVHDPDKARRAVERLKASAPEYAWIGLTGLDGRVIASTGGLLEGVDVSARPWFKAAQAGPYVGDVHAAALLAKLLPQQREPWRFVDFAMPVKDHSGKLIGVLGAHLSWAWARSIQEQIIEPGQKDLQTEVWIVKPDGEVLLGPAGRDGDTLHLQSLVQAKTGSRGYLLEAWPDGKRYATGYIRTQGYMQYPGLSWIVLARQPEEIAFAAFRTLRLRLVLISLIVCVLAIALARILARRIARPLHVLSERVGRHAKGDTSARIPLLEDYHEAEVLSKALSDSVDAELRHIDELARVNASLEERVETRTLALSEANDQLGRVLGEQAAAENAARESEELLRDIIHHANEAYVSINTAGNITAWNSQAERIFGWRSDEVLGKHMAELIIPPQYRAMHTQGLKHFLQTGEGRVINQRIEITALHRDGSEFPIELTTSAVKRGDDYVISGLMHDISERKLAEQAIKEGRERLKTIADNLPVMIAYIDTDRRYRFSNAEFTRMFGIDAESMIGRSIGEMVDEDARMKLEPYIERALQGERVSFENIVKIEGSEHYLFSNFIPHIAVDGQVLGFYLMTQDITARKQLEMQLERQALQDELTQLPNRRALFDRLPQALARADRWGKTLALFFLDLDGFKQINDRYGHEGGDELLRLFARRLENSVRQTDTVARLAGDEFTVLLEALTAGADDAYIVARKIIAAMQDPFTLVGHEVRMTTSIGIALYTPKSGLTVDQLVARADSAMYSSKRAGKNQYHTAGEPDGVVTQLRA